MAMMSMGTLRWPLPRGEMQGLPILQAAVGMGDCNEEDMSSCASNPIGQGSSPTSSWCDPNDPSSLCYVVPGSGSGGSTPVGTVYSGCTGGVCSSGSTSTSGSSIASILTSIFGGAAQVLRTVEQPTGSVLVSRNGQNYWQMPNGQLVLASGTVSGGGSVGTGVIMIGVVVAIGMMMFAGRR